MGKLFVNVGCGDNKLNGFLNIDIDGRADLQWDVTHGLPWLDHSVDGIYSEHFIEHLSQADGLMFLRECCRVLIPDGIMRIATPDLDEIVEDYRLGRMHPDWLRFGYDWIANRCERINISFREWGHQWLYNEEELLRLARHAGLRYRGRFPFGESQHSIFRSLEHREGSRLILEFDKPDFSVTTDSTPLVSVLIPAWNPRYFARALSSACDQTYPNLEILIGDDCRSDAVGDIVRALAATDTRIRYSHNPERLGGRRNLLALLETANGDFVKFLNDDDWLDPRCVERLLAALRACPGATFATSRRRLIDAADHDLADVVETLPPVAWDAELRGLELAAALLASGRNFVGEPSTVLIHKRALDDIGPDPMSFDGKEIYAVNDVAMWINLALRGNCVYLAEPLSAFRRHPEQRQAATAEVAKLAKAGFRAMRSAWERLGLARGCRPGCLVARPAGSDGDWREIAPTPFGVTYRFSNAGLRATRPEAISPETTSGRDRVIESAGVRAIAFYLPQFHPIPENDTWWGKGFTEWRNVAKAQPLFEGHEQPRLPADLGFYDLRVPEVREAQAKLAREYGIHGFCYYFYWFSGRRVLERPLNDMLKSGRPDFPFCLCWANENWSRRWDGSEHELLLKQDYGSDFPGRIFQDLLPALQDRRYIRVNDKPLLLVYRTDIIPDPAAMVAEWRRQAQIAGFPGLYLVRVESFVRGIDPRATGFDAACEFPPHCDGGRVMLNPSMFSWRVPTFSGELQDYEATARMFRDRPPPGYKLFKGVMPAWDNTARRDFQATIFHGSTPEIYREWMIDAVRQTRNLYSDDERLLFINAWNEWAEGAYLEPDLSHGNAYLAATREALDIVDARDPLYERWCERERWPQFAAQHLLERATQWQALPVLEVIVLATDQPAELDRLAQTIDTLATQTAPLWRLTVMAPMPCPDPAFGQFERLAWKIYEGDPAPALLAHLSGGGAEWVLAASAGTCFEPVFVNLLGEYLDRNPRWRVVYTDEDRIDPDGRRRAPQFKPGANPGLLLATPYIGHACMVRRAHYAAALAVGARFGLAANYLAALACLGDRDGETLGHVAEPLVHLPDIDTLVVDAPNDALRDILSDYLRARDIAAQVLPGLTANSFFVDFSVLGDPLVSIIVPTRDRHDLIRPCLDSLLEKTDYPNIEVLVVDNGSVDRQVLAYYAELEARDKRVRILRYPHPYNFAAMNNCAVREAQGEFVVLLNNDTVALQPQWLCRMLSIGQQLGVGAVGCRLVYPDGTVQHAGVVIGLNGIADHVGIGQPIDAPGYLGRAQMPQDYSAVTAACMLVRRATYLEVGGLDERGFPVLYNDIDFCLRLRERGLRVVWTPFATLLHHGSSSLKARPDPAQNRASLKSADLFCRKWLDKYADDPAYSRHLSLAERDWRLELELIVPWNPDVSDVPRLFVAPCNSYGTGEYRARAPMRALEASGKARCVLLPDHDRQAFFLPHAAEIRRARVDALLVQNALTERHVEVFDLYRRQGLDCPILLGLDDLVFEVPAKSEIRAALPRDAKKRLRKMLRFVDRLIVATEPIAEAMREMIGDIRIVPNRLESARWLGLASKRRRGSRPRVGWAGGGQHAGDLELLAPVIKETAEEVDWVFFGMCLESLRPCVREFHPGVTFADYPAKLASLDLDLAVAPLEHNRFNVAKSNLRLLEYGVLGWPVVCTDILPYRDAPVCRVPNNPRAWIEAIRARIHDLPATWREGDELRAWVRGRWMLEDHLEEWREALLER